MTRHLLTILFLQLAVTLCAEQIELPRKPSERPRLKSIYSAEHDVAELASKDTKAVVLIFLNTSCPVARQYMPTFQQLHKDFHSQGVRFYGIYPNASENVWEMAIHAHDSDLPFPVFLDNAQKLSKLLDVTTTPEVVLLDAKWNRHYQGAIDDQIKARGGRTTAINHYLRDAITNLLAGQEVSQNYLPPSGCPLEKLEAPVSAERVTYHKDIAPILQKNCQGCHRPGGVGPFELMTYEDAYYSAERIKLVVHERRMPPWHANLNPKFGKLAHDTRLSEQEIKTVLDWVAQDAPEGDPKEAPPTKKFPEFGKWEIGKPDFVYEMPKPFQVPKHGQLEYQFFRVKLNFPEDRWFNAVEVQPGNPEVVHHIGVHLVEAGDKPFSGFAGMAALYGISTEQARLLNDYVPGDAYNAKIYPAGKAVRIPKHTDLIFEMHYTPNGKDSAADQSRIAFRWADQPPEEEVMTKVFRKAVGRFRIPPHDSHFHMVDTYYFEEDIWLDAIRPHYHYRGKSFRLEMVTRDEKTDEIVSRDTVLSVPVFDQGWQRTYELEKPLFVPAGTELIATGTFDNSKFNPKNPNPEATVLWGQQTTDEMFSTRFKYHLAEPSQEKK